MTNRDVTNWREGNGIRPFLAPFSSFRRELDRLFDDFLAPGERGLPVGRGIQPDIAIQESQIAYIVTAELPGIDQKDVQVELKDDILTIAGEKREEYNEDKDGRRYNERS